jgi:hypothetical protein
VNLADCEICSVLFGPHGRVEEWNLTKTDMTFREIGKWIRNIGLGSEGENCQNHPITAVVDGDWSEIGVT